MQGKPSHSNDIVEKFASDKEDTKCCIIIEEDPQASKRNLLI